MDDAHSVSSPRAATLEACALRRYIGGRWAVDGVDLVVHTGEIVGLLGPNGAGKTLTLTMIAGLLPVTDGRILLDGIDVTQLPMHLRARHGLGYLSQERSIFHGLNAEQNVAALLECGGRSRNEARQGALRLLGEFGIAHLASVRASRLSGGEQRRLEIARSLASDPRILLVDEPFAGIDPITIESLHTMLLTLRQRGVGILITDHNVQETLALCDRAYVLFDGKLLAEGTPAVIRANADVRQRFLGESFEMEPSVA